MTFTLFGFYGLAVGFNVKERMELGVEVGVAVLKQKLTN